jgi:hypothetical protein
MNPRITKRERGLLKGAIRRVFSRSELRRQVIEAARIEHSDSKRKRVKKWCKCNICGCAEAISNCVVDHRNPVIPVDSSFEELGLDSTVDRLWCDPENLQCVCDTCHLIKSKLETRMRRDFKKEKKCLKKM